MNFDGSRCVCVLMATFDVFKGGGFTQIYFAYESSLLRQPMVRIAKSLLSLTATLKGRLGCSRILLAQSATDIRFEANKHETEAHAGRLRGI